MITEILSENARRHAARHNDDRYDPAIGNPSDPGRVPYTLGGVTRYIPAPMAEDPKLIAARSEHDFAVLRFSYDFEFWAYTCVTITDKMSGCDIKFRLNRPQRRLVGEIESQRLAGRPLRLIMLKARQWGGSTLVQVYFAWIQIIHRRSWNSLICAHVKDTAATIRGMYSKLLSRYPEEYWTEDTKPEFRPFERMNNTRRIPGRECKVTVCSSENQESTRGLDCAMAHLSEVAFWKDSTLHNPTDLIRSVTSGIARKPLSFIAMESTANGVGNFFHREWMRACGGKSDKIPFFVPWHEIDIYTEEVDDPAALWESLDDYERDLWERHGCTLEAICWYHNKRSEFLDHRSMMAEYPTTPDEAFSSTTTGVFSSVDVERLRASVCDPAAVGEIHLPSAPDLAAISSGNTPDLSHTKLVRSADGNAKFWKLPCKGASYIVSVDIGGRTRTADFSVITVISRTVTPGYDSQSRSPGRSFQGQSLGLLAQGQSDNGGEGRPEVVAQWRGHLDHDLLAWKAAAMGSYYNDALLVVESNTWESSSEGHGAYILSTLAECYPNLYHRDASRPGFHTNQRTKPAVIANLIAMVRDGAYIEHDNDACDELLQYEQLSDGSFAARRGCHDDILMTRAIALYVDHLNPQPPACRFTPEEFAALQRISPWI